MSDLAAYTETRQNTDSGDRNELVTAHAALVKRIAYHLMNRLPASVLVEDLIQSGMIGLMEAAQNYDASQGASFETYAGIRIRGAMLDEIRKGDWTPRSLHRKVRQIAQAVADIEARTGRDARDAEVADKLELTLEEYHQTLHAASTHRIFSLEDIPERDSLGADGLVDSIPEPQDDVEREDFRRGLASAITSLPERERLIMSLYYDEELNLREIGEVLGVSESRVCQIHAQALIRLRARMKDYLD